MKRILVLCYEYPPIGGGGGRVAAQVAAALAVRGYQVTVVTAGMPHLPERTKIHGVDVIRVRSGRRSEDTCSIIEMLLWVISALPIALRETRNWRPDVIHSHFAVPTGAVAWIVHLLTKVPYVLTAHLGDVPGGVPEQTGRLFKIVKPLTVPIWKTAAKVTAVSSFVAGLAKEAYGITSYIILNGTKLRLDIVEKKSIVPQLLIVGRLSVQKNPLLAVQSLALLRNLPWNLQIIGDGPLRSSLQEEIHHYGLEKHISLLGWASTEEVHAAMEASDILLMPSLSEGLPMVAVESLVNGLAIVGSRIGGLQDVVEEGKNGCLFDLSGGAEAMAKALRPLLEDHELLRATQAASGAKAATFEWGHSIDRYEEVLKEAAE